jgi:hypothetical protein
MKRYVVAIDALLVSTALHAFEVSEDMLNQFVKSELARSKYRDLHLSSPYVTLLEGYATFCAVSRPSIYPRDIRFCANLTPKWRQEMGSLFATRLFLASLSVPGADTQQVELVRTLANQTVLPVLEGVELYRTDDAIGKQVSSVTVLPGRLVVDF